MPRTAYYGVVTFLLGVSRIYAIPAALNENLDFISQPSSAFYNTDWDKMTRYLDFQETYCRPGKYVSNYLYKAEVKVLAKCAFGYQSL